MISNSVQDHQDPGVKALSQHFARRCVEASIHLVRKLNEKTNSGTSTSQGSTVANDIEGETMKEVKIYNVVDKIRFDQKKRKETSRIRADTDCPATNELKRYFNKHFDWREILSSSGTCSSDTIEKIGYDRDSYQQNWELIASEFDIMAWWEARGKQEFPKTYLLACVVLPLPESNGSQERTFSTATWMDGKLNNRQTDTTFEMKVLLHQNAEFLRKAKMTISSENQKSAEEAVEKAFKTMEENAEKMEQEEPDDVLKEFDYFLEEQE
jgi:hAT family C-terminal dimerisation region